MLILQSLVIFFWGISQAAGMIGLIDCPPKTLGFRVKFFFIIKIIFRPWRYFLWKWFIYVLSTHASIILPRAIRTSELLRAKG